MNKLLSIAFLSVIAVNSAYAQSNTSVPQNPPEPTQEPVKVDTTLPVNGSIQPECEEERRFCKNNKKSKSPPPKELSQEKEKKSSV